MNKKGQGYVSVTTMELVFLVILIIFFSIMIFRGIEEQKLNQIKAGDLALAVESVAVVEGDVSVDYEFGEVNYNVEELNDRIRVWRDNQNKMGLSRFFLGKGFDFAEQVKGKVSKVRIKKEGRRVVVS